MTNLWTGPKDSLCLTTVDELRNIYTTGYQDGSWDDMESDCNFRFEVLGHNCKAERAELSENQMLVLQTVSAFMKIKHCAPTVTEVSEITGLSREGARKNINKLVDKGYLGKIPYERRGLVVTDAGRAALEKIENRDEAGSPKKQEGQG